MNTNNYIGNAVEEFYRWYEIMNKKYYGNNLPIPVITIQKTRSNILGHASTTKVWVLQDDVDNDDRNEENCKYEINISAQALCKDKYELSAILNHELVHLYNLNNNIKDLSGNVHNKKFKQEAESRGLVCEKDKKVGWGYTRPSDDFKKFVDEALKPNMETFEYCRIVPSKPDSVKESKIKYKYECPLCHKNFKSKNGDWEITCKSCGCDFEVDEA